MPPKNVNPAVTWRIAGPEQGQAAACEPILRALPAWFGIEDAIVHYAEEIDRLPTFRAVDAAGQTLGFASIKQHTPYAAEVYVMAVRREAHRQGIGRALVVAAEDWLRGQGVEYLQVKTLSPTHADPNYARTRAFYAAVGFRPLEELEELWGEQNPCLLMVKRL
jgi:GNAT superfamily N-acetyltransferase